LGAVGYFLLSGHPPLEGKTLHHVMVAHLERPVPPLDVFGREVPLDLEAAIRRAGPRPLACGVEKPARIEWIRRSRIAGFVVPVSKNLPPCEGGARGVTAHASGIVSGSGVRWQQRRVASRHKN